LFSRSGASLRDPMFFAAKNSFDDTQKLDDPPTSGMDLFVKKRRCSVLIKSNLLQ